MAPLSIIPEMPAQVLSNFGGPSENAAQLAWQATHHRPAADRSFNLSVAAAEAPVEQPAEAMASPPVVNLEAMTRVSALEAAAAALQAVVPPERGSIVRARFCKVHLAQLEELQNAPVSWRAKCGWSYGTSDFYRVQQLNRAQQVPQVFL